MVSVCGSELVVLPEVEKEMDKWMMLLAVSFFSLVVVTDQVKQAPEKASSQPDALLTFLLLESFFASPLLLL